MAEESGGAAPASPGGAGAPPATAAGGAAPPATGAPAGGQAAEGHAAAPDGDGDPLAALDKVESLQAVARAREMQLAANPNFKGWKVSAEDYAALDPAGRLLVDNLRTVVTNKTKALGEEGRKLAAREAAIAQRERELEARQTQLGKRFADESLDPKAQEGEEPDQFTDPGGYARWHAVKAANERILADRQAMREQLAGHEQELAEAQTRARAEAWAAANPAVLVPENKAAIIGFMQKYSMDMETAWKFVQLERGERPGESPAPPSSERAYERTSRPGRAAPAREMPTTTDLNEIKNYINEGGDKALAEIRRLQREGVQA